MDEWLLRKKIRLGERCEAGKYHYVFQGKKARLSEPPGAGVFGWGRSHIFCPAPAPTPSLP